MALIKNSALEALQRSYYTSSKQTNKKQGSLLSPATKYNVYDEDDEEKKKKDNTFWQDVGNFFEGVGYLGHKVGLGFLDSVEGTVDYLSSTFSKIFGNDDAAERILRNDWVNYNAADDWFEPNEGWKTAGDIAGGVGNAAYTIGLGAFTYGIGAVIGGATSAAGNAAQEAYRDSGEYGWDEFGYASGMGAIEGGLEAVIGKAGKWSKSLASSLGLSIGKSATSKVAATTVKSVAKKAVSEFASEGFEEMITEFVTPYVKRATYDPNAKNATADEILYAGLVGGLTGVIMGGGVGAVNQLTNLRTGKKIADTGSGSKVLTLAEELMNIGGKNNYTDAIKTVYDKVSPAVKSGAALNVSQKRALGELQRLETGAVFEPIVKRSAISVVKSADAVASRLNSEGVYKIVDGKMTNVKDPSFDAKDAEVRDITAEDITRGIMLNKKLQIDKKSFDKALQSNDVLRFVAASDAAGRLMMSAAETERAAYFGSNIKSEEELKTFVSESSPQQKTALAKELGIENLDTVSFEEFNTKAREYKESGKAEQFRERIQTAEQLQRLSVEKAEKLPKKIRLEDGEMKRYSDGATNIAVARRGDAYIVHDFTNGETSNLLTKEKVDELLDKAEQTKKAKTEEAKAATSFVEQGENLTTGEANAQMLSRTEIPTEARADSAISAPGTALQTDAKGRESAVNPAIRESKDLSSVRTEEKTDAESAPKDEARAEKSEAESEKERRSASEIAEERNAKNIAREKIADFDKMDDAKKEKTVSVLKNAVKKGVSAEDATMYARVSARSGLDIVFDKEACLRKVNGEEVYAAGFYDPENNRIVVNPDAKKKHASLLIHELSHAIRSYVGKDNKIHYISDKNAKISDELWEKVKKHYSDQNVDVTRMELMLDEASAYYAEEILGTDAAIDLLLGKKKTLKEKILSFFKGAARDYSGDAALSKEARKFLRSFKKMFDAFAEKNQSVKVEKSEGVNGNVDNEKAMPGENAKRFAEDNDSYDAPIKMDDITLLREIGNKSINDFTARDIEVSRKWAYKFYKELGVKSPFFRAWFGEWRAHDKSRAKIITVPTIDISKAQLNSGNYKIKDTGWDVYAGKTLNDDTRHHSGGQRINIKALNVVESILSNSILLDTIVSKPDTNKKSPNTAFLHKLYTLIEYENQMYISKVSVEEFYNQGKNGISRKAYNLKAIKIEPAGGQFRIENSSSSVPVTDSTYSISDLYEFVKSYDKDFSPAPEVNKVLLNDDGTPKIFYHGTEAKFTEFSPDEMSSREGSYFFAENREDAAAYGKNIYKVYLSARNLADYDNQPYEFYRLKTKREQVQWLKEKKYDGWYADMESEGWGELSVFSPEQIKSATDNIGTFSKGSKDIRYSMDEEPNAESPTLDNVGKTRFEESQVPLKTRAKVGFVTIKDKAYIELVDELWGVEKYLKKFGGMKDAESFVQQVRASETMAQTMIGVAQYDVISGNGERLGDGLTKIFKPFHDRRTTKYFNDYLLHYLNVDRMSLNERSLAQQKALEEKLNEAEKRYRAAQKDVLAGKSDKIPQKIINEREAAKVALENFKVLENKPVFGKNEKRDHDITAEESKKIIAEYERKHSDFKAAAEKVWLYSKNLQRLRVESGLLSQNQAKIMEQYYPHYVPAFRDITKAIGTSVVKNASQLAVNSTVKKAYGGSPDVYDVEESIAVQTRQTVKAMQMNRMANAVFDASQKSGDTMYVLSEEAKDQGNVLTEDDARDIDLIPKNNQIVFFKDGKRMTMDVTKEIFDGFNGVVNGSVPDMFLARAGATIVKGFKSLVTSLSPAFSVRNVIRDLQDAIINTKHPALFSANLIPALTSMVKNDADWQLYLAHGGYASTVFDGKGFQNDVGSRGFESLKSLTGIDAEGFKKLGNALQDVLISVSNANAFVEQFTRFTEFKASLKAGDSIQTAINNSADVTTNFARHGKTVKVLNATFIPFLNASVQGFDKFLRVIAGPAKEKSLAALAILFAKIFAIGIAPQILNMIMNGDDEDYENLSNEIKENYFLIKVGDDFLKIPRGRAASIFGGIANRIKNVSDGEDFDLPGYLGNIKEQLTPIDSFSSHIFTPVMDAFKNKTWYGGEIEGRQFDSVRPSQRYDESTSSIAIWLGDKFNVSPKKIHYVMDQYSGVIGDFLLPVTTKKAEKDYLSANFLLDPRTNNKLSSEFYEIYDEAQYATKEGNITAYYQLKHLNGVKDSVSELYDQINKIQASDMKDSEKLQEVRVLRVMINNLYKTAKVDYAAYTQAVEATNGMFDDSTETGRRLRHTAITQMMYGSEKALEEYNASVYEKSKLYNAAGLSYDTFYEFYFSTKDITPDVDRQGNEIAGSKRKKTIQAINSLGTSAEEKLLMICASGYAVKDGDIRGYSADRAKQTLYRTIKAMNVSEEERIKLAEACGFKVKNGRILIN